MAIKTTDGHTVFEGGGDIFILVKLLTLHLPNIHKYDGIVDFVKLEINVLEAVIDDIFTHKKIPNAILGVNVMLLFPIMKDIQIIDGEGFKLWCILYFIWNMQFCKNKGFGTQESFAQNYPALIKVLLSFGYTPNELLDFWGSYRTGSLMTFFIDKYR